MVYKNVEINDRSKNNRHVPINRIFSGYAGWKPRQLEAKVAKGYWLLQQADTKVLFHTEPDLIWRRLLDSPSKGLLVNLMGDQSKKEF